MAEVKYLISKDKENLSYLYELPEFKSFKKLCDQKRMKIAAQILSIDMSENGASNRISMLQGQYFALEYLLQEMQSYYKKAQKVKDDNKRKG